MTIQKKMYCLSAIVLLLFLSTTSLIAKVNIVPLPMKVIEGKGFFNITPATRVLVDENDAELQRIAHLFTEKIRLASGKSISISNYTTTCNTANTIIFTYKDADKLLGNEGYTLDASPQNIVLRSTTATGIFYGLQSLFQLLPVESEKMGALTFPIKIQEVSIVDKPRFGYRGLHLDVCRHMFPVEFLKKYIDLMAQYKYNTFHWHLTEDQGWRIEIKKYPKLTQMGGWRNGTQIGKTQNADTISYGGFYTQDEAREIVAYAAQRFITVIPEIEMPGHSVAALTAYPEYSCTGGPFEVRKFWGVSDDIYCAGKEKTFDFLQDILTEIMDIFPSTYIHIGGDEAPKVRWEKCADCQKRIKDEGLKNEFELQSYFIKRIEKFLILKGRKLIGWDEILEGGLAPEATVMVWRGLKAGMDASAQGHDVIMTPMDYCYFDYYQSEPSTEPIAIGGRVTLKTVYSFNPVPKGITLNQEKHYIGIQGNVWTEFIKTSPIVEYRAYPRALALAEVAWSPQEKRNWAGFLNRMDFQYARLKAMNINYGTTTKSIDISTQYDPLNHRNLIVFSNEAKNAQTRYTLDGSTPKATSKLYIAPFPMLTSGKVNAALFQNGKIAGPVATRDVSVHKAAGKPVKIIKPFSPAYTASGDQAMTDGFTGTKNSYKTGWQGYEGSDMEFVIDLLKPTQIHSIKMGMVSNPGDWVMLPSMVNFSVSTDGNTWKPVFEKQYSNSETQKEREYQLAEASFAPIKVRYIKVSAISPKVLPEWAEHKGELCWIFADEVIVE